MVDSPETMFVRLSGSDTTNTPIKYAWKRVTRDDDGTWMELAHNGTTTTDYAVEVNNNNVTTGTGAVYRAWRSLTTPEWLFFGNGTVTPIPPPATCNAGNCAYPPSTVTITFPTITNSYTYPTSFPNWNLNPGYQCFYNIPGDPRDGSLRYESVNGWTFHSSSIYKKIDDIMSAPVSVPTSLGSWLETEIDISGDFADFFPMQGDYKLYAGPGLFPDPVPQMNYEGEFSTDFVTIKRFVSVRMTNGGACTMRFEAKQRVELVTQTSFSETTYNFGPFGVPAGSTTQEIGCTWTGSTFFSARNPCGSDGDPAGADAFAYDNTTISNQTQTFSQGGTGGFAENIDCGLTSVDYSD